MAESTIPSEWGPGEPDQPRFTMHNVERYKQMALEPHFDNFLRVWFFAVANMTANGHASLKQGRLAHALGRSTDGMWVPAKPDTVKRAIALAKEKGLLDERSKALCLIPTRMIAAQGKGNSKALCPRHDRKAAAADRHLRAVG